MKLNHTILTAIATTALVVGSALSALASPAVLTAQNSRARINVRSQPTTQAVSPHYGLPGDRVDALWSTTGRDNARWYYVKFPRSGAEGWVRGDLLTLTSDDFPKHLYEIEARRRQVQRQHQKFVGWEITDVKKDLRYRRIPSSDNFRGKMSFVVEHEYRVTVSYNPHNHRVSRVEVHTTMGS